MIREPPPFFHRGPSPLARLTFFTIVAIAIMIADHRFHALESVRLSLSVLTHPIQQLVSVPGDLLARAGDYFTSQSRLLRENADLKVKVLENAAAAQEAKMLRAEHQRILAIAERRARYEDHGLAAEVIYAARNPFTRKIVIDKGLTHGIQAGMPVVDGDGIVGQVTNVGTFTSEVTLVTEKDQSVPVMITRNGLRAIAVGSGKDGSIDVPFVPVAADVQNGDLFVTSGIDGTYPAGLVVATVTRVDRSGAYAFAKITARPAAGVENNRFVLVLAVPASAPPRPEAKEERKPPREKPGKGKRDAAR
jgi:rod shape-determining protein MreC